MSNLATTLEVNGDTAQVIRLELHVPSNGPWYADATLAEKKLLSGKVSLKIGDVALVGTVANDFSGGFVEQSLYRVVAGANGWSKQVKSKAYHNDALVSVSTVVNDTAREVGETIGTLAPPSNKFQSADYFKSGLASKILDDCAGGFSWWVDFDGKTNIAERATSKPDGTKFQLIGFDPITRSAKVELLDIQGIQIGSVLHDERLDKDETVRSLTIVIHDDKIACDCWCSDNASNATKLAKALRALIKKETGDRIFGKYRYRVISQSDDDRLSLEVVNKSLSLPDAISVPQSPISGLNVKYSPGCIVHVEFLEGDASLPRVTGCENWSQAAQDRDPASFPESIELGGPGTQSPIAITGSLVQSGGIGQFISFADATGSTPLFLHNGVSAVPGPYLVSFGKLPPIPMTAAQPLMGAAMSGSKTAKAGPS